MRWGFFAAAIVTSILLTALMWWLGFPGFFLFLFLPLLGLAGRGAPAARCPTCGRAARAPDDRFCPRDGTPL